MLLVLLQGNFWLWDIFIGNPNIKNAEMTAQFWFYRSLMISVIFAGIFFAAKFILKKKAPTPGDSIWKRIETWRLMALFLVPAFLSLATLWYMEADYYKVLELKGLLFGALVTSFSYIVIIGLLHLFVGWRREYI